MTPKTLFSKHNIDHETTSYQVALKMVDCIQDIKDLLEKRILSKYEIDSIKDLFDNCLEVDNESTINKNYLSDHKIIYCMTCGSTVGCNCKNG